MNKGWLFLIVLTTGAMGGASAQVVHWISQPGHELGFISNADAYRSKLSANGQYLTFSSFASNLVADDINHQRDVFLLNLQSMQLEMVSVLQNGDQAFDYGTSSFSAPTSDGRYVAFVTWSTAFPDAAGFADDYIYVKDLQTGAVVNHSDYGTDQFFEVRDHFHLSDDASTIYFDTYTEIDPLHTSFGHQVYKKVLDTDTFELISISADGLEVANDRSELLHVSDNSRYVLFSSEATNLTNDVINNSDDNLYLRDTQTNLTTLINKTPSGDSTTTGGHYSNAAVSNTGTVVFVSDESELVANDHNGAADVFYYDGSQIHRINLDGMGNEVADAAPFYVALSGDGSRIAFTDRSTTMMNLPDENIAHLYAYDTNTQALSLISNNGADLADNDSEAPHFSTNGARMAFTAAATNLINTVRTPLFREVYVHSFTLDTTIAPVEPELPVETVIDNAVFPVISSDQRFVAFMSQSPNITAQSLADDTGDLFLFDRQTNTHSLIGKKAWGISDMSPSGRYIVFRSDFFQPDGDLDLGENTLFLYDRINDTYTNIANSYNFAVNDDGLVVFETDEQLALNDTNGFKDIYLFNPQNSQISLISEGMSGSATVATLPDIGGTGNQVWISFGSASDDLVNGDTNGLSDIFVRHWPDGTTIRASQTAAGVESNAISYNAKISANGEYVAFITEADNLTTDDYSNAGPEQILRFSRLSLAVDLVSRNESGDPLKSDMPNLFSLSISDSGRYISYEYEDDPFDLDFTGDEDNREDIILYDAQSQTGQQISNHPNGSNVAQDFSWSRVVEDLNLSPPRIGVAFEGPHDLTNVANHPAYDEIYLYQDGGPPFTLSVDIIGMGMVTGTGGINCTDQCDYARILGSEISLVAVPDNGETFESWDLNFGECDNQSALCELTITRDITVTVTFSDNDDVIFVGNFE